MQTENGEGLVFRYVPMVYVRMLLSPLYEVIKKVEIGSLGCGVFYIYLGIIYIYGDSFYTFVVFMCYYHGTQKGHRKTVLIFWLELICRHLSNNVSEERIIHKNTNIIRLHGNINFPRRHRLFPRFIPLSPRRHNNARPRN